MKTYKQLRSTFKGIRGESAANYFDRISLYFKGINQDIDAEKGKEIQIELEGGKR